MAFHPTAERIALEILLPGYVGVERSQAVSNEPQRHEDTKESGKGAFA
ncbi:MAG TPA: hypothetical protein V6D12_21570 [Candidatus Obscuribacterales bacterium]